MESLPKDYLEQVQKKIAALPPLNLSAQSQDDDSKRAFERHLNELGIAFSPQSITDATAGRRPLLILGASGTRWWERISKLYQTIITDLLVGLVSAVDPQRSYLLIGRPKNAGITTVLSDADCCAQ